MAWENRTQVNNGPIPGENYTSDTKNYPWHRPPKFTDLDEAIEYSFKHLMANPQGLLTLMELGMPIVVLTELFLLNQMGKGMWTPDYMLLLAGPVAHIMYLMAKGYGIDPNMDIFKKQKFMTGSFIKKLKKLDEKRVKSLGDKVDLSMIQEAAANQEEPDDMDDEMEGFMPDEDPMIASQSDQMSMLGQDEMIEPEDEGLMQ